MQLDTSSAEQAKRGSADGTGSSDTAEDIEAADSSESAEDLPPWSPRIVHIRAAITGLDSPIIPFVVLKYDPCAGASFEQESRCIYTGQPRSVDAIREWWNAPLCALPADRRYFLLAWSAVEGVSPRVAPIAGLSFGIATPGPSNKRWITTNALDYRGKLVAWCEEIDMSGMQEDIIEVLLSEERMIRLLPGHVRRRSSKVA